MIKTRKDNIPIELKHTVWNKYSIYPLHKEITQCRTCDNLVLIPESIRHLNNVTYDIKPIYIESKRKIISGVAEFGHIISEKNGGKVEESNLIIQCKTCNLKQYTTNIEDYHFTENCEMIDAEYDNNHTIEMGEKSDGCNHILSNRKKCQNKPLFNRQYCHIHLTF